MNSFIETLNQWGGNYLNFAWPMFWQSSLLIATLFAIDCLFRHKIRASIRYALWLVVLVKLCLPPALALPTSPAWWVHQTPPPAVTSLRYSITYDSQPLPDIPQNPPPAFAPPKPEMTNAAWLLVSSAGISSALLLWLLARWWQIRRQVRHAAISERLSAIAREAQTSSGMKIHAHIMLTANSLSPAVCGLFRPVILIPQSLVEGFSDEQLRAVLLHELIHVQRRDVWLNFFQSLLQIVYWWHPLLWLANARIRRVREEAVDDAVMLALRDEAESYAPALLEVAKLALNRPLASLGLVGILESRSALRQRIERLVDFRPPRKAGLTLVSLFGILAFTAVAVPMGEAPDGMTNPTLSGVGDNLNQTNSSAFGLTDIFSRTNAAQTPITRTFRVDRLIRSDDLKTNLIAAGLTMPPTFVYFKDNGILLASGSKEQLALVHRMVLKLNGFLPEEIAANDKQFAKELGAIGVEDTSATNLFMRTFKMDPNAFLGALRSSTGLQTNSVSTMARTLFSKLGVDLESPKGKSVFYNDGLGMVFVKATESDLNTIERAIQAFNYTAPQIHIKARFVEVPAKGFVVPAMLTNTAVAGLTGILTGENLKTVLKLLEAKPGFETLAEPEVVTTSGRQTEMRATTIITVVTNFSFQETATNTTISPQVGTVETGPVLDTVASVLSDGYTIYLRTTASLTEFLGYDTPTNTTAAYNAAGEKIDLPKVLPRFRVRQARADLKMRDGQTVILGKLENHTTIGAVPPGGWLVRAKPDVQDKEVLIFITVTIVDPAGNRIHSGDDMQFAKDVVPNQSGH